MARWFCILTDWKLVVIQRAVMQVLGWESEFLESVLLLPPVSQSLPLAGE